MSTNNNLFNDASIRRNVAANLFGMEMSRADIASALGISQSVINNDFQALGGKKTFLPMKFVNNTARRDYSFRLALLHFEKLNIFETEGAEPSETRSALYEALSNYLNIKRLRNIATGIAAFVDTLQHPISSPKLIGYQWLLNAIFSEHTESYNDDALLRMYLKNLFEHQTAPTRDSFPREMAEWARKEFNGGFRPTITTQTASMVNAELAKLSPNGEKIIRLRFGLGCNEPAAEMGGEPWTIEQCAQRFEMGEFWVRQTEAKALRQLRNPERSHHLRFWIESAEATALRWLGEQTTPKLPTPAIIIAGQVTPEVAALVEKLNKSIEDINEMSVRSYNCLKNSGIQTIRELAEKTEDEMLQIKNFGRRNLDEMRGILASMDLMFGMRFTE